MSAAASPEPGPGGGADPPEAGPLDAEQRETLRAANERLGSRILGSEKVAGFNAWTLAIFGGISLLTGVFSAAGLVVGAGLLIFAWNEFRGRALLRRLDRRGPRVLAWNQIALAAAVLLYCGWSGWRAWARPDPSLARLESVLGMSPGTVAELTVTVYAAVFVVTALFLGFTARYHFVRASRLEAYLERTPGWVVEIQRSMR